MVIITNMTERVGRETIKKNKKPRYATRVDYAGESEGTQYPQKTRIRLGTYLIPHPNPENGSFEIVITRKNLYDWQPLATFLHD